MRGGGGGVGVGERRVKRHGRGRRRGPTFSPRNSTLRPGITLRSGSLIVVLGTGGTSEGSSHSRNKKKTSLPRWP